MDDLKKSKDRKIDHIKFAKEAYLNKDYFKDIRIFNNSLPEINYEDISLKTKFLGKEIDMPIMINAMTGGCDLSFNINRDLSKLSKEFNIPMAVGSQSIMFKDKTLEKTFKIVRDNNKDGVILSNLSALSSLEKVKRAIDVLEADGIQLHLNSSQELVMREGDRNFKGILKNIENIISNVNVPVILKEVGSGISFETCKKLESIGAKYIDVGGKGGTSFIKIEALRSKNKFLEDIQEIEIPTPESIIFCKLASENINIISSGGINKGSQIIKSLILGSKLTAIAGPILQMYLEGGIDKVREYIKNLNESTKILMGSLGCSSLNDLNKVKYFYKDEHIIKKYISNYKN